jgi:ssRNA-specific RNase YbeY (16S rRNA maturation enzyme)
VEDYVGYEHLKEEEKKKKEEEEKEIRNKVLRKW